MFAELYRRFLILTGENRLDKCKYTLKDESLYKQAPYGMPDALKPAVVAEIIKLLENGFIVECENDLSARLVIVRKRD